MVEVADSVKTSGSATVMVLEPTTAPPEITWMSTVPLVPLETNLPFSMVPKLSSDRAQEASAGIFMA